jgi:hypothetical protein
MAKLSQKFQTLFKPLFFGTGVLAFFSCGAEVSDTTESPEPTVTVSYMLSSSDDELNLATNLAGRISNIEFDVFATCTPSGTTNSFTHSSYTLGNNKSFTVGANCGNPLVNIENLDVTYQNVNGTDLSGTLATYGNTLDNESSILKLTQSVTGSNAEFLLTETILTKNINSSDVEVEPTQVSVILNNDPNSYCSGATATPSTDKITVQFDSPEDGSPPGTYTFASAASGAGLPTGTSETETPATRTVEYDFSAVSGAALVGSYEFTMTLTPDSGQTNDDEYCEATITFDLQAAAVNHIPTFAYDTNANVANFAGYGISGDAYTMDVAQSTSNGEVSFTITDEDGQSSALIECVGAPTWVNIDDANDKITFSPGVDTPGNYTFTCNADDGTDDSLKPIYFDINLTL